jgi:hypothetical protein
MRIGFGVEGATDRAFITGLRDRFCPRAELEEGSFRGTTDLRLRAEIPKICKELIEKNVDVIVFLTDSSEPGDWHKKKRTEYDYVPNDYKHLTLYGVTEKNIETWITADKSYIGKELGVNPNVFNVPDPKSEFERVLGIVSLDKKEGRIAEIVKNAPIDVWKQSLSSFNSFYEDIMNIARDRGCINSIR